MRTDHKALEWHEKLTAAAPRLIKLVMKLQPYSFTVVYKKGEENHAPDWLSRSFKTLQEKLREQRSGEKKLREREEAKRLRLEKKSKRDEETERLKDDEDDDKQRDKVLLVSEEIDEYKKRM
ncbi:MAG: hypothetical protein ACK56F_03665, partial [bacterium]